MLAYSVVHRIPIVQQVGDSYPGLTARAFSRWSREIYLNFPEAARRAQGAPRRIADRHRRSDRAAAVAASRRARRAPAPGDFPTEGGHVLLVYGGSQGSLAINRAVAEWIERGLPRWRARHLGHRSSHVRAVQASRRDRACAFVTYLSPIADAYAATDLALSRAGAMTTAELFAWGIPAVLVPLPTAAADHQTTNAVTLERAGAAVHIPQAQLTIDRLDETMRRLLER